MLSKCVMRCNIYILSILVHYKLFMVGSFIAVLESERFWFIFKGMKLEDIKARIESFYVEFKARN